MIMHSSTRISDSTVRDPLSRAVSRPTLHRLGQSPDAQNAFKQSYFAKWGSYPDMMGASTYEGVYIAAEAIENAGSY